MGRWLLPVGRGGLYTCFLLVAMQENLMWWMKHMGGYFWAPHSCILFTSKKRSVQLELPVILLKVWSCDGSGLSRWWPLVGISRVTHAHPIYIYIYNHESCIAWPLLDFPWTTLIMDDLTKHLRTDSVVRLWDVRKFSTALKSFTSVDTHYEMSGACVDACTLASQCIIDKYLVPPHNHFCF